MGAGVAGASWIELEDVRVNNLRGIHLKIRHGSLTVICGVSGSGKSSLAFDTLYAEGQRRYIETFSPYARQFLDRIERPAAASIDGIPPAIAIRQIAGANSQRSTVGSRTEILDDLRLLLVQLGTLRCPKCRGDVPSHHPEQIAASLASSFADRRVMVCFPWKAAHSGDQPEDMLSLGFTRAIINGRSLRLAECRATDLQAPAGPEKRGPNLEMLIVADRLKVEPASLQRLSEAVALCYSTGCGECVLLVEPGDEREAKGSEDHQTTERMSVDDQEWMRIPLYSNRVCPTCRIEIPEPSLELLNFNSSHGACSTCQGLGMIRPQLKVKKGRSKSSAYREPYSTCPACSGKRLRPESNCVVLWGRSITELSGLEVSELYRLIEAHSDQIASDEFRNHRRVVAHLRLRLEFLLHCGLGYLTLDRSLGTLSGGEKQRVILTTALGAGLMNALYILDEPTSGLHVDDTDRIISVVKRLRDSGNTVVVVEHDPAFILAADEVVEIGPGAGDAGGRLVFTGTPAELLNHASTATALALKSFCEQGRTIVRRIRTDSTEAKLVTSTRRPPSGWLRCRGVNCNNLENVSVDLPLGVLCVVTGPGGSGKSSLIVESIYPELCRRTGQGEPLMQANQATLLESPRVTSLEFDHGDSVDAVVLLSQDSVTTSSRSVPVTWIGAFDDIRKLLAETHEAKKRNFTPSTFSFNSSRGGRCPVCEGNGIVTVEMHFLADIETPCEVCGGRRFRTDVLEVRYRDRSVYEILAMTVDESFAFFGGHHRIQQRLGAIRSAGLGYLKLGQTVSTLSGGEMQRLRIAALLAGISLAEIEPTVRLQRESAGRNGRNLFLLDEPSTGLHLQDIDRLMDCLSSLVQMGHSVVIIEHDNYLISLCDYQIELGPGAGRDGGKIVRSGPVQ
ncbi:MAG: excinuclease ABC subunit UvrA [Planctomyces sp.]|nr:excinuclease ABC subunit UvrA [Planctomyces sp.]